MLVFQAPKLVLLLIEIIQRCLLWAFSSTGGCLVKVSWDRVCRTKLAGGLVVRNLEAINKSLLLKWWWRFSTELTSLWRRALCARHGWIESEWNLSFLPLSYRSSYLVLLHIAHLAQDPRFPEIFGLVKVDCVRV